LDVSVDDELVYDFSQLLFACWTRTFSIMISVQTRL
jgi:hypothetical protein